MLIGVATNREFVAAAFLSFSGRTLFAEGGVDHASPAKLCVKT